MMACPFRFAWRVYWLLALNAYALPDSRCGDVLLSAVQDRLASISEGRSSVLNANHPITPEGFASVVLAQMQIDEAEFERGQGFFSQFRVDDRGHLHTIVDPTIHKDSGEALAERWNQNRAAIEGFRHTYAQAQALGALLQQALPRETPELAEVVFTHQIRKPSEGWHLDWYPTEYLIATQTFIAKAIDPVSGDLVDSPQGGTEYLLNAGGGLPQSISFRVNKRPALTIHATGYRFTTPTGLLSLHSGTSRVAQLLGPDREYDLASPPHRGSQIPLEYRASIAVRFTRGK